MGGRQALRKAHHDGVAGRPRPAEGQEQAAVPVQEAAVLTCKHKRQRIHGPGCTADPKHLVLCDCSGVTLCGVLGCVGDL